MSDPVALAIVAVVQSVVGIIGAVILKRINTRAKNTERHVEDIKTAMTANNEFVSQQRISNSNVPIPVEQRADSVRDVPADNNT